MKLTKGADSNGTSYRGEIRTDYDTLVSVFGMPDIGPDNDYDKVTCEWCFSIDGIICTIYDWKQGKTPYGVYDWHIGGHTKESVEKVKAYFEEMTTVQW